MAVMISDAHPLPTGQQRCSSDLDFSFDSTLATIAPGLEITASPLWLMKWALYRSTPDGRARVASMNAFSFKTFWEVLQIQQRSVHVLHWLQESFWQYLVGRHVEGPNPDKLVWLLKGWYSCTLNAVQVQEELTDWFKTFHGCILAPLPFSIFIKVIIAKPLGYVNEWVEFSRSTTNNLHFADDTTKIAGTKHDLQLIMDKITN